MPSDRTVALVLAGGGARGAYEIGALSVLLPALERRGERVEVIVGTSVGAINAAFLAATAAEPLVQSLDDARSLWVKMRWDDVLRPLLSAAELAKLGSSVIPGVPLWGLLDAAPLERTLGAAVRLDRIRTNVAAGKLRAAAVVATAAHDSWSVVFHDGGGRVKPDADRAIEYVQTKLESSHVRASAAIPGVFPAVEVRRPSARAGRYYDGGTRLNTPIKPALKLGGKRVIVIALNSLRSAGIRGRPEALDGATQIVQALLVDPLVHDVQTLATINEIVRTRAPAGKGGATKHEPVPYMLIAPREPNEIGAVATRIFNEHYAGLSGIPHAASSIAILGRALRAGSSAARGELLSYLFFAPEFAKALLAQGAEDAKRWLRRTHDDGPWRYGKP
jgi:NTE family protein